MRRSALLLLIGAAASLVAGAVHVTLLVREHLRHPEWSAPAHVNLIFFVPYVLVSASLVIASWWVDRRPGRPRSVAPGQPPVSQ